jgi:hypothetical protein
MTEPWCIYRTAHPSGHFYQGKGMTAKIMAGKYTGSGIRYNLSLTWPGYEPETWLTHVIATFATEGEAYTAEEELVTHESLANPYCLNMMCGGRRGKYKTPSSLLRRYRSEVKRARGAELRVKAREKVKALKEKAATAKAAAAKLLKAARAK